jgi:hypothetical protein
MRAPSNAAGAGAVIVVVAEATGYCFLSRHSVVPPRRIVRAAAAPYPGFTVDTTVPRSAKETIMTTTTAQSRDHATVTPTDDNREGIPAMQPDDGTERLIDRAFRIAAAVLLVTPVLLALLMAAHGPAVIAAA